MEAGKEINVVDHQHPVLPPVPHHSPGKRCISPHTTSASTQEPKEITNREPATELKTNNPTCHQSLAESIEKTITKPTDIIITPENKTCGYTCYIRPPSRELYIEYEQERRAYDADDESSQTPFSDGRYQRRMNNLKRKRDTRISWPKDLLWIKGTPKRELSPRALN